MKILNPDHDAIITVSQNATKKVVEGIVCSHSQSVEHVVIHIPTKPRDSDDINYLKITLSKALIKDLSRHICEIEMETVQKKYYSDLPF